MGFGQILIRVQDLQSDMLARHVLKEDHVEVYIPYRNLRGHRAITDVERGQAMRVAVLDVPITMLRVLQVHVNLLEEASDILAHLSGSVEDDGKGAWKRQWPKSRARLGRLKLGIVDSACSFELQAVYVQQCFDDVNTF